MPTLPNCLADSFEVDFLSAALALPEDTQADQREQLRDWLWATTLGHLAKGSSVGDVFAGVVDQPLLRDDSMAHVLRLPIGPTRATTTKSGEVLVLVEATTDKSALEAQVLEAIDEQTLALGRTPDKARVYGFELKPALAVAKVCQIAAFEAREIEEQQRGFRKATVRSVAQLDQFLADGVDLLSASCGPQGLELAGRRRARNVAAAFTSEHVAALAQPLGVRYVPAARFGKSFDDLPESWRHDISRNAASFDGMVARQGLHSLRMALLLSSSEDAKYWRRILAFKEQNSSISTRDAVMSDFLQRVFDGKPGFSLDAESSAQDALRRYDEIIAALPKAAAVVAVLKSWGLRSEDTADFVELPESELVQTKEWLQRTRPKLADATDTTLQSDVYSVSNLLELVSPPARNLLREVMGKSAKQCARYDGPLAGTEAGMTFFYTDVSAKFFALDSEHKSPEGTVPGFQSVVNQATSTATCEEPERPRTRIWFGVSDQGYKRERNDSVRFAPVTTRLFAMGSVPGSGEAETEPNASFREFIGRWSRNYAAIAEWDAQYETLNQLMKWSIVVQQARATHHDTCLSFLKDAPFRTDRRLSDWAASKPHLRWHDVLKQVETTQSGRECLPLIRSDAYASCGSTMYLTGGVSAGSLEEVSNKPVRSTAKKAWVEGLAADNEPTLASPDHVKFDKLTRAGGGVLTDVELLGNGPKLTFRAKVDSKAGQVGHDVISSARAPVTRLEKTVERKGSEVRLTQRDNDLLRGGLTTYDIDGGIRLEVTPGAVQRSKQLAQRVAAKMAVQDDGNLASNVVAVAGNTEVYALRDGSVAVKHGGDGQNLAFYSVMSSGTGETGPPDGLAFSVGSRDGGRTSSAAAPPPYGKPLRVHVLNAEQGARYLAAEGSSRVAPLASTDQAAFDAIAAAARRGSFDEAAAALKAAHLGYDELSRLEGIAREAQVLAARQGKGTEGDLFMMKIGLELRRRGSPTTDDLATVSAQATRVAAPSSYPIEAGMPPALHPRGARLQPKQRYVSRVLEMPGSLSNLRELDTLGGERLSLKRVRPRGRVGSERPGSGMRLLAPARLVLAVVPCDDSAGYAGPRCTAPVPAVERERSQQLVRLSCSDGWASDKWLDEKTDTPSAPVDACARRAWSCDRDKDGSLYGPGEQECLKALSAPNGGAAPPSR